MLAVKGGRHKLQRILAGAEALEPDQNPDADREQEQDTDMEDDERWCTPWGEDVTWLCWRSQTGGFGSSRWTRNGWILDEWSMRQLQKEFPDENLEKPGHEPAPNERTTQQLFSDSQSTVEAPGSPEYRRGGGIILPLAAD